jgi:hypothetical protein
VTLKATPFGPTLLTGVVYNGIAVFDFSTIKVDSDQVFVGTGTLPLALLSRGDINLNGTIDVSAPPAVNNNFPSPGGPGGFDSAHGPGAGASGFPTNNGGFVAPGGGGFGGAGGNGGLVTVGPNGNPIVTFAGGAPGGSSYGNLGILLQGGSGGGNIFNRAGLFFGGGGGGAIEVGAVGGITIAGSILANGGSGMSAASGGSGGGIFLHGDSVALSGVLSAEGGGNPNFDGGGGGGGGRVDILTGPGGFTGNVGGINVSGGAGGTFLFNEPLSADGAPGVAPIPEPASLVLVSVGMLGVLCCTWGSRLKSGRR